MFNNTVNFLLFVCISIIVLAGCSYEDHSAGGETDAIYWHEGLRYTAVIIDDGVVTRHGIPPWGYAMNKNIKVYTDAEPGEKSWYRCGWTWNPWTGTDLDTAYCNIHIHNLDELGTADWNHGKFGSGSTTRID